MLTYTRDSSGDKQTKFSLFQPGKPYRNPGAEDDDILGIEAIYVGEGTAQAFGDPTTLLLTSTQREARRGDRVMPFDASEINELEAFSAAISSRKIRLIHSLFASSPQIDTQDNVLDLTPKHIILCI